MHDSAKHKIRLNAHFGGVFGAVLAYWLINDQTKFNKLFLTFNDEVIDKDATKEGIQFDDEYHTAVSDLQFEIGFFMLTISLIAILNSLLRFDEKNVGYYRSDFSNSQREVRKEKSELAL